MQINTDTIAITSDEAYNYTCNGVNSRTISYNTPVSCKLKYLQNFNNH